MASGVMYTTEGEILEFINRILSTDYEKLTQVPTEKLSRVKIILEITLLSHENLTLIRREQYSS